MFTVSAGQRILYTYRHVHYIRLGYLYEQLRVANEIPRDFAIRRLFVSIYVRKIAGNREIESDRSNVLKIEFTWSGNYNAAAFGVASGCSK